MDRVLDLATLSDLLASRFEALSPQLREAGRYLLAHPEDVALRSMRELARAAALPAVTFVRLARALGFADYSALRRPFEERLRGESRGGRYSAKARRLQLRGGEMALLKDVFSAELDNIELTFERNHPETVDRALGLIEGARRVYVLGQRSCYPTAFFFNYVYRLFRANSVLVQSTGGMGIDELRGLGADDLIVAISVAPYTAEVVEAVHDARAAGARILAITDEALSPIARAADETLLAAAATPSFFHSTVSTVVLAQTLLALLMARGGEEALAALKASEQQLERRGAYWPGAPRRRRSR
jgi:DNA-binding MurR/RpiR family transcriptional regulator